MSWMGGLGWKEGLSGVQMQKVTKSSMIFLVKIIRVWWRTISPQMRTWKEFMSNTIFSYQASGSSIQGFTISLTSIPNFSSFPGWRAWEEPEPSTRSEPAEATAVGLSEPGDWEAQTEGKNIPSPSLSSCPRSTWTSSTGREIASYNESCFYICARCALYQIFFANWMQPQL